MADHKSFTAFSTALQMASCHRCLSRIPSSETSLYTCLEIALLVSVYTSLVILAGYSGPRAADTILTISVLFSLVMVNLGFFCSESDAGDSPAREGPGDKESCLPPPLDPSSGECMRLAGGDDGDGTISQGLLPAALKGECAGVLGVLAACGDDGEKAFRPRGTPSGEVGRLAGGDVGGNVAGGERERDMALATLERSGEMGRILVRSLPVTSAADTIGTS